MNRNSALFILLAWPVSVLAVDADTTQPADQLDEQQAREVMASYQARPVQAWKEPADRAAIDQLPNADAIKYGIQVLEQTATTIGPDVADQSKRFSGNQLNCSSCHLKGNSGLPGTKQFGVPFVNVMNDYPKISARSMTISGIEERVNGCMTRSMADGKALPLDSKEMQGVVAYFTWLAQGSQQQAAMQGTGLPSIDMPKRKSDVANGKTIYQTSCVACHAADGLGTPAPAPTPNGKYLFPPLAGDDTFNDGAGMSRLIKATRFIYGNMPLGTQAEAPVLTIDQAYDVAAYMLSLPRPHRQGRENDFPDPAFRPKDYPVPEYFGDDQAALERAKLGPFE